MNLKKAKAIRKLAKQICVNKDLPKISYTKVNERNKVFKNVFTDTETKYQTYTIQLEDCQRKVYKDLKNMLKNKILGDVNV